MPDFKSSLSIMVSKLKSLIAVCKSKFKSMLVEIKSKKEAQQSEKKSTLSIVNDNIKTIIAALIFAIIIRSFLFEPYHIPSGSMKPTLLDGDYIFVSKYSYGYSKYSFPLGLPVIKTRVLDRHKPQRGDVVVFRLPSNPRISYIKRLVGLPNDRIQIINKVLYINGEAVDRSEVDRYFDTGDKMEKIVYQENIKADAGYTIQHNKLSGSFIWDDYDVNNTREYVVPENHYFFLGDNRDNSLDSRFKETGFVPYENIIGKAKIIFLSKEEKESLWRFWQWHKIIRFERMFNGIK